MNLYEVLKKRVRLQPKNIALCTPQGPVDYSNLIASIDEAGKLLKGAGVLAGDVVGFHVPSGSEYIIWAYATWKCEATLVPIAVELTSKEKGEISSEIGLNHILTTKRNDYVEVEGWIKSHESLGPTELRLYNLSKPKNIPPEFSQVNAAFIRFSSGTTGKSKGVVLSHESVLARIEAANRALNIGPQDRVVWLLSMSYHFTVSIVSYLSFGAGVILCRNHLGQTIFDEAKKHRGTLIYGSPLHYELMAHIPGKESLPHLRLAISTASFLPKSTAEEFYSRFGLYLSEAYGLIEVGLPCINTSPAEKTDGSVGKPLPDFEIQLKDVGLGSKLKSILVRGEGCLDAYYSPWRSRAEVFSQGWFETGDLGYFDQDGYLYIQGRLKEIINSGGHKFFPQEVEQVIESHPLVEEALVYPKADKILGEVPWVSLVLKGNGTPSPGLIEEVVDICRSSLSSQKIPRHFDLAHEIQKTASGKRIRHRSTYDRKS